MKICGKLLCLVFLETQRKALLQKNSKQISRYCPFKQRHPLIFIPFLEQVNGTKYLIDLDPLTMSKDMNDVVKFFQSEKGSNVVVYQSGRATDQRVRSVLQPLPL
jgi:hypothetical protein